MKELCEMMEALTEDARFTEEIEVLLRRENGEDVRMCEYIDFLESRGEKKGVKRQELCHMYGLQ